MTYSLLATFVLICALSPIVSNGVADPQTITPSTTAGAAPSKADVALAGTAWQLVEIVSVNDRVDAPDDRSLYTLAFQADGSLSVSADCNRGTGYWTSPSPGQLQFGQFAATQALCPPGSLHDRYMTQFPWVRSYVMKNGHLFLATMADGAIIEFEPMQPPLAATVLGEEVRTGDPGEMQKFVLTRLFDRYAKEQGIEVTDQEIDAYVDNMRRGMRAEGLPAEDDLAPKEVAQVEQMRRDMGRSMIRQWKLNRALYRQYGGRIIFQQFDPEPLDAYRHYLTERQAAGDFTIHRKDFEDAFWHYFTNDSMHDFYESGSEEEAQAFKTTPWEHATAGAETTVQPAPSAKPAASETVGPAEIGAASPLAATRWRLRQFQSMDDATGEIEPEDPSAYTMTLNEDGSVQMQLNCNRAVGTWSVAPASDGKSGAFTFGRLVTTKALCPPPSMDERIVRDAEWIRGYLLRDGQLHLSLMADGGIYSWERVPEE